MTKITIVGLGPGAPEQLTREAWDVLAGAGEIWLRTARHPMVPHLPGGAAVQSFDDLYERGDTFEDVYAEIVEEVLYLGAREEGVVYAVPGHPLVGEATVTQILQTARDTGVAVRIVGGLSFVEPTLTALALDALDGVQIVDALDIARLHHPTLDPDMPALVAQVYSRAVASELKLVLMNQYADEHLTALVDAAGTNAESVIWGPLYEIDRHETTPLTSLYVAPCDTVSGFENLQETMAQLRAPDGCPWDREQTHESLRSSLLEETYEVLNAVDTGDVDALCEELGDVLLQVLFHAQIATEDGDFRMTDVIAGIDSKLKHRHPHVWGNVEVADAAEVTVNWELIKRKERQDNGQAKKSLLDGIPAALPALSQANAYASRAARIGLDWSVLTDVVAETQRALQMLMGAGAAGAHAAMGEVLSALTHWSRQLDVDAESALREANARFAQRLRHVEQTALARGVGLESLSVEEKRRLWNEAPTA